ncbi:MAG TPA: chloride channel protein [Planctomycetota bacterium]|nr:chloride channel protein [Planctomycetota bacterium]
MRSPPRRLVLLCLLATLVGFLAGGAAYVLVHGIGLLTNIALFGRIGWEIPSFAELVPSWRLLAIPLVGAALVVVLARWSPIIRGHGIPEAMEAILRRQSRIAPRTAVAKPLSAAIAIGTGGPFGAEGPIIVTGGALGSLLGQAVDVSPSERKILLASGAAAGMAATFGAPLASVVIAIELLLFEFSTRAFIPVAIASSIAAGIHSAIFGTGPLFHVPPHAYAGLGKLPFYGVLGVACGLLATVIAKGLFLFEGLFRRLPLRETWHPLVGALGFGLVGLAVPRALGVGYDAIDDVLAGRLALGALVALFAAKLLAWWIALASGTSGGTLAPVLLVSGAFGGIAGALADRFVPGLGITPGAAAVVAMAATFGAATRATFTSIVFLFELTRDYHVILPLMLASVLADLVAFPFLRHSLMTEKLARRGIRVEADLQADQLGTTTVAEVMTRDVATLPAGATHADALRLFDRSGHSAYPIVDADGRCAGMVSRKHLLLGTTDPATPILGGAYREVVGIAPDDTVLDALLRMSDEGVDHLAVLEGGRLVGICTRTDVLRVHSRAAAAERPERGWLSRASPRRGR